jgi:hypothetical protein
MLMKSVVFVFCSSVVFNPSPTVSVAICCRKAAMLSSEGVVRIIFTVFCFAWYAAVQTGNLKVLEALWNWAKEAQLKPNELYELLRAKNKYGKTAWHAAVQSWNIGKPEALWSWANEAQLNPNELSKLLRDSDEYGNTTRDAAVQRCKLEKLETLWSWAKETQLNPNELSELLLAKDKYGDTAWHAAVHRRNI